MEENSAGFLVEDALRNQFTVPDQIVTDPNPNLSNDARMLFVTAVFYVQKRFRGERPFTKEALFSAAPWLTKRKYERVVGELTKAGYLVRRQVKSSSDGRFGQCLFTFVVPKLTTIVTPIQPYLESRRVRKTPGQSRSHGNVEAEAQKCSKKESPSSDRSHVFVERENDINKTPGQSRSHVFVERGSTPLINKQTSPLVKQSLSPEGDIPSNGHDMTVIGEDTSNRKDNCSNNSEVCLFGGEQLRARKAEGKSHVLRNCTEEQAMEVFDMVAQKCSEKRFRNDQYLACRKKIDELLEGNEVYKSMFMSELKFTCFGAEMSTTVSTTPSYWLNDDFGDKVRANALATFEEYGRFA